MSDEQEQVECAGCTIPVPGLFRKVKTVNIFHSIETSHLVNAEEGKPCTLGAVVEYAKEHKIDGRQIVAMMEALQQMHHGTLKVYRQLPGFLFQVTEQDQQIEQPKLFDGTLEQALEAGWVENEFGLVCPTCAETAHSAEDATAGTAGLDEFMAAVGK